MASGFTGHFFMYNEFMQLPSESEIAKLPKDGGNQFNRLIFEDSLYLKHHAHQKINWYSWGADAFELAKIANKPLFLSIGYSSCHWCHVMSETTFDRPDVAKQLNDHFVAIKIDRDQLPDIDQIYMAATQLLSQQGGWPNSVFCLPTGQPFYAGTYFPADDHSKGPGFLTLLDQLAGAWKHQRDQVEQQALEIERVIKKMNTIEKDAVESIQMKASYDQFLHQLIQRFDPIRGGFGVAPKFPPYAALRLLLSMGDSQAIGMVETTLTAMANSGLYDHVDGGFHRYSTDAEWHLPHFEKMLSDNAQMIEIYSLMQAVSPSPLYERVVSETIQHLNDQWQLDSGGYLTTIDADSDGEEGTYYVMRMDELTSLDHSKKTQAWATFFQFTDEGNMRDEATGALTGYNIFHPVQSDCPFDRNEFQQKIREFRLNQRQMPNKDQHLLISANALLIKGLCIASRVFKNDDWAQMAQSLLDVLMDRFNSNNDIVYVDDVVYLLDALVELKRTEEAQQVWLFLLDRFYDHGQGGLWFSQESHRTPISRIKDIFDRAEPSPNGRFIDIAFKMAHGADDAQYYHFALDTMTSFLSTAMTSKTGVETYWSAVLTYWQRFNPTNSLIAVQIATATRLESGVVLISLDLVVDHYLMCNEPFQIMNSDLANWLQFSVDPLTSRRVDFDDQIVQCATGTIRVEGRINLDSSIQQLELSLPVCSDEQCFKPVVVTIPVTKK